MLWIRASLFAITVNRTPLLQAIVAMETRRDFGSVLHGGYSPTFVVVFTLHTPHSCHSLIGFRSHRAGRACSKCSNTKNEPNSPPLPTVCRRILGILPPCLPASVLLVVIPALVNFGHGDQIRVFSDHLVLPSLPCIYK